MPKNYSMTPENEVKLLFETVKYYNSNNRGVSQGGKCSYINGCAIGRRVKRVKARELLDKIGYIGQGNMADKFNELLPEYLTELTFDFLTNIQDLHDISSNWNKEGLSELGQMNVNRLVRDFKLQSEYEAICKLAPPVL